MIIIRSKTLFPPHPDLFMNNTSLISCDNFKIFGIMPVSKFNFEKYIHSILLSSSFAQKTGLFKKSEKKFWGQWCLTEILYFFYPSFLQILFFV